MFTVVMPVSAVNIGTYKTETEYGLLDGYCIIGWSGEEVNENWVFK